MGDAAFPLAQEVSVHAVVQRFYELKQKHVPGAAWPKQTKKAQTYAARFLEWCKEKDLDPFLYMQARFESVARAGAGKWPALAAMRSPKFLERWEMESGRVLRDQYVSTFKRTKRTEDEKVIIRLMRKPSVVQESLRARYLAENNATMCLVETEHTGGYDARSKHCPACPIKYDCLLALNQAEGFDVGALRVRMYSHLPQEIADTARRVNKG